MGSTARAIDRSPVLIKSGDDVYPFLENYGEFTPVEFELLGKKHWAYPFSRFGTEREGGFVFISNFHHYGSLYYQNKSIWRVETPILFRNQFLLQSALNGGLTVKWALPVYKAMIRFGMQVIPGGKWAGRGMSLMSLATFWAGHLHEIEAGIELTHYLVRDLRTLYKRCPLLTKAMLLVAMEETITDLRAQIKKEGLFTVIADNADGEKYMETVATFFGALLKMAIVGNKRAPIGWLSEKGFKRLANLAGVFRQVYKYMGLYSKGMAVAAGPGVKDAHLIPPALLSEFTKANVQVYPNTFDFGAVCREGCLSSPEIATLLGKLQHTADQVQFLVKKLTEEAEYEVF
jgi:hypothetical protein